MTLNLNEEEMEPRQKHSCSYQTAVDGNGSFHSIMVSGNSSCIICHREKQNDKERKRSVNFKLEKKDHSTRVEADKWGIITYPAFIFTPSGLECHLPGHCHKRCGNVQP